MTEDMAARADRLVRGIKVSIFPLHTIDTETDHCTCGDPNCSSPGKHPLSALVPHGVKHATNDPSAVAQWWALYPDANIAIATGSISNIIVVDIDPRSGGNESWHNLIKRHGDIDDTWTTVTGGNGYHYYFQYEEGLRNRTGMVPGIDLKTDGGYVVAPPSLHESGNRYEWMAGRKPSTSMMQPDPMPEWLIKLAGGTTGQREKAAALPEKISEGGRNHWLASIAGTMRARNMSFEAVEAALLIENRGRCEPPLDEREVVRIARSIDRYPAAMASSMTFGGKRV